MSSRPQLGSLAVHTPSQKQVVRVTESTCQDLSLFKDLLKEYRKMDDSINMRLNRTTAHFRDQDRLSGTGQENVQDESCAYFWRELVENWKRRTKIINYCATVADESLAAKRAAVNEQERDPATQRRIQGEFFADQVKRNQIHGELTVEKIVQQRSLEAFRSRCKYFQPPTSDAEARELWAAAQSRR